jgi:16S rRNA (uracil1498-N3)-methyltransferase
MLFEPRHRLYCTAPLYPDALAVLDRGQSHYLINVLRMGEGDNLLVFNGVDGEWLAAIEHGGKKQTRLRCLTQNRPQHQHPHPELMLVFAPIKKARIDFIAEKATELGAGILQPMMTDYTQMSRVNISRMTANAIEAAEQTGRMTIPEIRKPVSFDLLLETWPQEHHIIFCDESQSPDHGMVKALLEQDHKLPARVAIFTGPEGGFSPREREVMMAQAKVQAVSLGRNILRADTAMLAALAIWQATVGESLLETKYLKAKGNP